MSAYTEVMEAIGAVRLFGDDANDADYSEIGRIVWKHRHVMLEAIREMEAMNVRSAPRRVAVSADDLAAYADATRKMSDFG